MPERPTDSTETAAMRVAGVDRRGDDPIRRLNPLTQIVAAVGAVLAALIVPTIVGPALVLVAIVAAGVRAGIGGRAARSAVAAGALVGGAIAIIGAASGFGSTDGAAAVDGGVRAGLVAATIAVWTAAVDRAALRLDLERRGVPHATAVAIAGIIGAGPAFRERVRAIVEAQTARGYAARRGPLGSAAGSPVLLPALASTLGTLTERSLALESRAFGRPGRRARLWEPPDPAAERFVRWLIVVAIGAVVVGRIAGLIG